MTRSSAGADASTEGASQWSPAPSVETSINSVGVGGEREKDFGASAIRPNDDTESSKQGSCSNTRPIRNNINSSPQNNTLSSSRKQLGTDEKEMPRQDLLELPSQHTGRLPHTPSQAFRNRFHTFSTYCKAKATKAGAVTRKLGRFMGPGLLISCAYIDPGNYATDIAAGASYRYKLLFVILLSNFFATFLQSLCIKLGCVTGKSLPEMCREHFPPWLNYAVWFFNEIAIIATDIAEVIGFATALTLLSNGAIPLVAGCAISIVTVMFILLFYNPTGTMKGVRLFEGGVALLVVGVVICFCIQLSLIKDNTSVGEVFLGFVPSSALIQKQGLYQACGIIGATVMPHSLILGTGLVQPRLREFDVLAGTIPADEPACNEGEVADKPRRLPSLAAIRECMPYSIAELVISLFTFALFVNSAILIVAGADLYNTPGASDADLFGIYNLLSSSIGKAAGIVLALALLFSGISAGVVCTMAGQMVCVGQLRWNVKPWLQGLITRSISITPSIIIAGAVGRNGLGTTLVASQVVLSCLLPIISAPLIYFTCREKYMTITADRVDPSSTAELRPIGNPNSSDDGFISRGISMKNNWLTTLVAVMIWLLITVMNIAAIVLLIVGK